MRKAFLVVLLATASVACSTKYQPCPQTTVTLDHTPELGERLIDPPPTCTATFAASSQMWPSHDVVANGIRFTIGVDATRAVQFVATTDPSFVSPEGLHVGDTVAAAMAAAPTRSLVRETEWGHYIHLPSGWFALVDESKVDSSGRLQPNLGTRELAADASIRMFFKRVYDVDGTPMVRQSDSSC